MEFSCIQDCSQCCIERQYYPTKRFGKVGVLILPEEKDRVVELAKKHRLDVTILPRIGVAYQNSNGPEKIIAYQMMGKEKDGNACPFLDMDSENRSPHGGYVCKIYEQRPLACRAYPLIEAKPITLDPKCKFCQQHKTADSGLAGETEALLQIKTEMSTDAPHIWRYATGVGDQADMGEISTGWLEES
jgi:Fe-S-cluster containining protein